MSEIIVPKESAVTAPPENKKALAPIDIFRKELVQMQPQFAMVLPAHVTPEKFVRVAMTAILQNPNFVSMDRKVFFQELLKCATDGLIPDGREAAMVPYKGKPKYQPMVWGIVKKVRNSGELLTINSMVVYSEDEFDYFLDEKGEHLTHRPRLEGNRGSIRLTYAIAQTKDGGVYVEIVSEYDMDAIRKASPSGDNGPWGGPFANEMRRKSAIKRLAKRLPMNTDVETVLERDAEITEPREELKSVDYQTIDVASEEVPPTIAGTAAPSAYDGAVAKDPKKEEARRPHNHAPGASNPPQQAATANAQAGSVQDRPTGAPDVPKPTREGLGKEIQRICKALEWKPAEAAEKINKMTGKLPNQLEVGEMGFLIDELKTAAAEQGVTV